MSDTPEQLLQAYLDEVRAARPADCERTLMWHLMKLVEEHGGDLDGAAHQAEAQLEQPPHVDIQAWTASLIDELSKALLAAVSSAEALQASLDAKRHDPGNPDQEMLAELERHLPEQ
ncbi:hypothetical protein [Halorhodospira halophila]|uniref:Uncharacterized protein n=1 Tax=Halorhodospira halophila (strain DSM 244 / SL1) TaxID=349124 RepID=A1WWL7_HALHL|nr:hypothetical protein [Halorhodospira halophila]ABM62079.1 hypothetical protein Hhal_1312 [Halorhodospira halophila SL1]MBK1729407.1 hypothetical protein [Halorhodospira halophila]